MFGTSWLRSFRSNVPSFRPAGEQRRWPRRGHVRPEVVCLEERCLPSTITGQVFSDLNLNGLKEANEPGLPGVTLFLDNNNNGVLDQGEPSAVSDASGTYSFTNLAAGN